jgi:hypothetical protein
VIYRVAADRQVRAVRTFLGTRHLVAKWRSSRTAFKGDLGRMLNDASDYGIRLVVSNHLTKDCIEAMAGRSYDSWADAQRAMATKGRAAWKGLEAWSKDFLSVVGAPGAAWSWEVVNEPTWMMGMDAGVINKDAMAAFMNHFLVPPPVPWGPEREPRGSRFEGMDDAQFALAHQHMTLADVHCYPDLDANGKPKGTNLVDV